MKRIKNIIFITGFLIVASSCGIDNVEPNNLLLETTVISDEFTAQNVLSRIYNSGLRNSMYGREGNRTITEGLSLADQYVDYVFTNVQTLEFNNNNANELNTTLSSFYRDMYFTINMTNFFIEALERGDANVSADRVDELVAEARFFRGLSHFNLLRVFGQFYDLTSEFGIVISENPIRTNVAFPRNNVADSYESIIKDLEFATANATTAAREHYYVTATTAQGLLARVQLYKQDYTNAAINALAVINNTSDYSLNPSYANVFEAPHGSETLLSSFMDNPSQFSAQGFTNNQIFLDPSPDFILLANEQDGDTVKVGDYYATGYDPRFSFSFDTISTVIPTDFGKYIGDDTPLQVLRMGEIYLIHAEAEARRTGGDLTVALASLNVIRDRADKMTPSIIGDVLDKVLTDKVTLLEDIREEKALELYAEVAEHWFDLVRYHSLKDIDALLVKPSNLDSEAKLIYPIPLSAIDGNSQLVRNPI